MLAVLIALAGFGPVKPVVAVAPVHYRIDAKSRQDVDLTAFGQPPQSSELTAAIFINVTMMDTTGGKLAHVVIDSMRFVGTGQMEQAYSQAVADSAKGAFIHAYIVGGKVHDNAVLSRENAGTQLARQTLSLLFAGTRGGLKLGEGWTDTTSSSNKGPSGTQATEVVTGWKVTSADGGTLTVEGTGNGKSSITDSPQGQTVAGTSTSKSTITAPPGGPSKSATLSSQQALQVTVPGAPEPIPVTVTSTLTLTLIN